MFLEDLLHINLSTTDFNDPKAVRVVVQHLSNLVETLYRENLALKAENQRLKDEINRLKGEKGKPDIKPKSSPKKDEPDRDPKPRKEWKKETKLDKVKIDETRTIKYECPLPDDAQHKGYRSVVTQGIILKTNNIEYRLERYYSPSLAKTYEAPLPDYVDGEFDATIRSWVLFWYFHSRMTENRIHQMLTDIGIHISAGEISNIIVKDHDRFHQEKAEIIKAGIQSSSYQHIDDTGARVQGTNQHFTVLCNDYFSAFFINPRKDRLSVIGILSQQEELSYLINPYTLGFLEERRLKASILSSLRPFLQMEAMPGERFEKELHLSIPDLKDRHKTMILEAAAIAAYQEGHAGSVIQRLVCDDAKQFYHITFLRALCWIHEERHYTKLIPLLPYHQKLVDDFRTRIWEYYHELKEYKKNPTEEEKIRLSNLFDEVFSTKTGYDDLDNRIELTKGKEDSLLVVLDYPDTPLHNNPAELALRMYVIKRKISFGTRSLDGTKSWETFFTIMDTCRKLGVNFRNYLYDRISNQNKMPFLSSLIPNAP
ncbi:transposase [bacterium]|nr:transposase [bacterium]